MRRTVDSDTPNPSKRRSTSEIRRVPKPGFFCFASTTLVRLASSTLGGRGFGPRFPGTSPDSPPAFNDRLHFEIADVLMP